MGQIKAEYAQATKFYLAFVAGTALIAMVLQQRLGLMVFWQIWSISELEKLACAWL